MVVISREMKYYFEMEEYYEKLSMRGSYDSCVKKTSHHEKAKSQSGLSLSVIFAYIEL